MRTTSANFEFLRSHGQLYRLAAWAESYFRTDPNTTLIKLRQFGELLAQDVAARLGVLASSDQAFNEILGALGRSGGAPRQTLDLFHWLRVNGNKASHENFDDFGAALTGLKAELERLRAEADTHRSATEIAQARAEAIFEFARKQPCAEHRGLSVSDLGGGHSEGGGLGGDGRRAVRRLQTAMAAYESADETP